MKFYFCIIFIALSISALLAENTTIANTTQASTTEFSYPEAREPQHLNLILQSLRDEQAKKCDYGKNPLIFDICTNLDVLNLDNYHLKNTRVEDLVSYIIRRDIIKDLQTNCKQGEWCFNEESNVTKRPLGESLMIKHANVLCLFASCFNDVEKYINNCVATEMSKSVLKTVPILCEASKSEKQFCLESTLQLFHVSAAVLGTSPKGALINNCESKLMNEMECRHECRSIALQTNKLDYCCLNTSLVHSFKPLNWITDNTNNVDQHCDLPLTGICWSDGKFYIGLSPNVILIAIVTTVFTMTIFFLAAYLCCFAAKNKFSKELFVDSISYSQLNNDVEEEMSLTNCYSDSELYQDSRKEKFDMVSQQGMSRFVNQNPEKKNFLDY